MAFLPAPERYNLMPSVDRWVIRTLFATHGRRCAGCPNSRADSPHACLYTINLSGATLNDDSFVHFLREEFAASQVPPNVICFEITETVAISNLRKAAELIGDLKTLGCRFALDDFGSGMSSLAYLKSLPVDYLKIDGHFVRDIVEDAITCAMVEAINRIGHVMGIQTIAEFVESPAVLRRVQDIGVDYAQGYAIAEPRPLSDCPLYGNT